MGPYFAYATLIFLDLSAGNIADILEEYEELNQSPASSEYCDDVDESNPAHPVASQESATSVDSEVSVSEWERNTYYNGIPGEGEDPRLLYRTGSEKYPWAEPSDGLPCKSKKSVHEVADTPLNEVWDTVGPQVSELVREKVQTDHSISTVRFATRVEDGESIDGPVVIWISVPPGSTSPNTAHEVSQRILQLLENNGVKDVEVEWCEAAVTSRSLHVI